MKTMKAIAALCAATMALSTMALPVQAKTSKNTEIITMDDTTKSSKSKKSTKAATDEYKDFGKDLKVTVHNPTDAIQAYLYANMMCAKSLKITFAKDYKFPSATGNANNEWAEQKTMITNYILYGRHVYSGEYTFDNANRTVTMKNFGDVMSYFAYVYRTGDTDKIPKNYEGMYAMFAAGVDSCTADADSITDVANNICDWLIDNTDRSIGTIDNRYSFVGKIGVSSIRRTPDNKMLLNCEGYSYVFTTMMRMAGYTAYNVFGYSPNGVEHCWNAIKVDDEYRYYDAGWTSTLDNMTYKETLKEGYKPLRACYRHDTGIYIRVQDPTQEQVEALFIDWH